MNTIQNKKIRNIMFSCMLLGSGICMAHEPGMGVGVGGHVVSVGHHGAGVRHVNYGPDYRSHGYNNVYYISPVKYRTNRTSRPVRYRTNRKYKTYRTYNDVVHVHYRPHSEYRDAGYRYHGGYRNHGGHGYNRGYVSHHHD